MKTTFALYFGNRGFFPASLIAEAREQMAGALEALGHRTLMLDTGATRYGAVETTREGEVYARFLREHRGEFGGVILSLPNFGDETGAIAALREAGVPILVQAFPDTLDRMGPAVRRDSFCGKLSIMDVFHQYGLPFTALKPHVAHPHSDAFAGNVEYFDRVCRVAGAMRGLTVGAIGARTTPFKTVRVDELALQRHGITVETLDMADVFGRVAGLSDGDPRVAEKAGTLRAYTGWAGVPGEAFARLAKLGVVLDRIIEELQLDAVAIRCWLEMQQQLKISPCVVMGELNGRGIPAACEVDVCSAVTMAALGAASDAPAACLDWNNNYGDDEEKCILFHCGPVPRQLMAGPGRVRDHAILMNATGPGCGWGCNTGRIAPAPITFGNLLTEAGRLSFYLGQGQITDDDIPEDFFGCAGVAEIPNLQDALLTLGRLGHRHHVAVTPGQVAAPLREAFEKYLGYEVTPV